jgi:decaprenylphospho-beta-D-erythro-pentofuranosid-2-ulose 2-reductase
LNKNILIIGGNSDIAIALSEKLFLKNFNIILVVKKKKNLIIAKKNYKIFFNDITNFKKTKSSLLNIKKKYKNIDCLVINSSITDAKTNPLITQKIRKVFELNFFSNINLTLLTLQIFRKSIKKVIHISSDTATNGSKSLPAYSSSKAAFDNFIISLKKIYNKKIKFDFIRLGPVKTFKLKRTKSKKWLEMHKKKIISPDKAAKQILNFF